MRYFKKLRVRHKVAAIGLAVVFALAFAAAATITVPSVQAQDAAGFS